MAIALSLPARPAPCLDAGQLPGFNRRAAGVANWAVAFFGRGRRQRTITEPRALAREQGIR